MGNKSEKHADNTWGTFFVDKNCIYCGLCSDVAPANFCLSQAQDHNIVYKQPMNLREYDLCLLALETCPVEAIGQDEQIALGFQPSLQKESCR